MGRYHCRYVENVGLWTSDKQSHISDFLSHYTLHLSRKSELNAIKEEKEAEDAANENECTQDERENGEQNDEHDRRYSVIGLPASTINLPMCATSLNIHRLLDQLLGAIVGCQLSGVAPKTRTIFFGLVTENAFDSGAGLSFVELVNLARQKGLVHVIPSDDGVQILCLTCNVEL